MSNWSCVTQLLSNQQPIELGRYNSHITLRTPRRMLYCLSYYKFAAKMIGQHKRVLDVGCNEGLGSWLIAKECGFCKGIDFDQEAIAVAQKNFHDSPLIAFESIDFFKLPLEPWDALINFDVIEHIYPEHASHFIQRVALSLKPQGIAIFGTPSAISQEFASPISKKCHVNIYTHTRFYQELSQAFDQVFLFGANDEVIHTGYLPLAHYFVALCCQPKHVFL